MKPSLLLFTLLLPATGNAEGFQIPFTNIVLTIQEQQPKQSATSKQIPAHVKRLTNCYSKMLDVSAPRIKLTNRLPEGILGQANHGLITLDAARGLTPNVIAHEMRHIWQMKHGKISRLEALMKPYYQRDYEIDAFDWADKNEHRCAGSSTTNAAYKPSSSRVIAAKKSAVKLLCSNGHKVKKGDTWYSLSVKYRRSNAWANARTYQPLRLGTSVCVRGAL